MIDQTGPSVYIYAFVSIRMGDVFFREIFHLKLFRAFNQVDERYSKETLHRAATCIQRWWRGYAIRAKWISLKDQVR